MLIIVGLGNPGLTYKNTIHNMGFDCVDKLSDKLGVSFKKKECDSKIAELFVNGEKIVLAKPQTYMNNSGEATKQLLGKYKAKPQEMIVVYDDIYLDVGVLRIRAVGSAGGHNGMKSIIANCSENFPRVRIGVGSNGDIPLVNYVLSKVSGEKKKALGEATERASDALFEYIHTRDLEKVGSKFNGAKL